MWEFIIVYINFIHFYKNQYEKKDQTYLDMQWIADHI